MQFNAIGLVLKCVIMQRRSLYIVACLKGCPVPRSDHRAAFGGLRLV